jgi:hypothetical protein
MKCSSVRSFVICNIFAYAVMLHFYRFLVCPLSQINNELDDKISNTTEEIEDLAVKDCFMSVFLVLEL